MNSAGGATIRLHERIQGRTRDVEPQILPTRVELRGSCGCPWDGPEIAQARPARLIDGSPRGG